MPRPLFSTVILHDPHFYKVSISWGLVKAEEENVNILDQPPAQLYSFCPESLISSSARVCLCFTAADILSQQVLIAGWDELECHRVFSFHCDFTNLHRRIQTVVSSKPGNIDWQKMTQSLAEECSVVQFANAIKLMHHDGKPTEWTADSVIGLLEELTGYVPNEWLLENQARLLLLCGNNICYTIMSSKAVNGRVNELANLMVFQALVCEKDGYHMQWVRKMLQKICMVFGSFRERCNFIQKVESVFCQRSLEILESIIEVDASDRIMVTNVRSCTDDVPGKHTPLLILTKADEDLAAQALEGQVFDMNIEAKPIQLSRSPEPASALQEASGSPVHQETSEETCRAELGKSQGYDERLRRWEQEKIHFEITADEKLPNIIARINVKSMQHLGC
ncbi:FBX47 protein, partial [Polypterus senegalus]